MPRDGVFLGALFESMVAPTVRVFALPAKASVGHLRRRNGDHEVDLVITGSGRRRIAVEALGVPRVGRRHGPSGTITPVSGYPVVWIFHGEDAPFASAVFQTRDEGLAWAAKHSVSGVLTEYPVGNGCYDVALALGTFTPTRPHHGTPRHVASFSPGWTEHVHLRVGRPA